MFSCFMRFLLFVIVCIAIAHAYPSSMSGAKLIPTRVERPYIVKGRQAYDYLNPADGNDNDLNDSNGFATWLFRSRKFCCAPPL